ncbi:MAG: PilZ domain-containing protein [Magnetococcales bacterium]|nr:PilZ domain-containing protein [Magnetococcales bacterium]
MPTSANNQETLSRSKSQRPREAASPGAATVASGPSETARSSQEPQKKPVQRDDRIPFSTRLRFESDDGGYIIQGTTSDVSMSGAFLSTETLFPGLTEGMEGVVFVEMSKEGNTFEVSFHCTIARITPRGLGLNFESEME